MVKNPQRGQGRTLCARRRNGARDLLRLIAARLHDPERNAFGRARPDSGHLPQLRDQIPDRRRIFRPSQNAAALAVLPGESVKCKRERLEPAQVKLQAARLLRRSGPARFLKFRVGFGPSFFAIKHDAVPEMNRAARSARLGASAASAKRFVNFVPFLRIHAAQKIDRTRHDVLCWPVQRCAARAECASRRSDWRCRNVAPIPPVRPGTTVSCLFCPNGATIIVPELTPRCRSHAKGVLPLLPLALFAKHASEVERRAPLSRRDPSGPGKSKNRHHAFAIGGLDVSAGFEK